MTDSLAKWLSESAALLKQGETMTWDEIKNHLSIRGWSLDRWDGMRHTGQNCRVHRIFKQKNGCVRYDVKAYTMWNNIATVKLKEIKLHAGKRMQIGTNFF